MKPGTRHSGISALGILVVLILFSLVLLIVLRVLPPWMEGRTVRSAISGVAEQADPSMSLRDISRRIDAAFNTNRVEGIKARDVKVYRSKEGIVIDASYEHRFSLFDGTLDAVLIFDDIIVTVE